MIISAVGTGKFCKGFMDEAEKHCRNRFLEHGCSVLYGGYDSPLCFFILGLNLSFRTSGILDNSTGGTISHAKIGLC